MIRHCIAEQFGRPGTAGSMDRTIYVCLRMATCGVTRSVKFTFCIRRQSPVTREPRNVSLITAQLPQEGALDPRKVRINNNATSLKNGKLTALI